MRALAFVLRLPSSGETCTPQLSGARGDVPHRVGVFIVAAVIAIVSLCSVRPALAYTIETQITDGCHESISAEALRSVRSSTGWGQPLAFTDPDDGPLVDDLPFSPPDDFKDIAGATLLLGVRDNDVKDIAATSLDLLAQLTADPSTQREHCLRSADEVEPDGTARAVADCRTFIKDKLVASLDGLGADGKPDVHSRDPLTVTLAVRGKITVNVPRFYLRAGQAIHAIQDSFTHTFRDAADPHKISVTLNWIDFANNRLNEAVGGPPHMTQLDRCDDRDELRTSRHHLAIEASAAALKIALDPTMSRDAKGTAFDKLLDTYIVFDANAGCNAGNDWCHAAENQYRPSGCACDVTGARSSNAPGPQGLAGLGLAVAAALVLAGRRANAPGRHARKRAVIAALVACAGVTSSRIALADAKAPSAPAKAETPPSGPIAALEGESRAGTPGRKDKAGAFFGHIAAGVSYDRAAMAVVLGASYQLSPLWAVGLDAEWNPWISTEPLKVRSGAANVYASVVRRYQMQFEAVNFRTTASLGVSSLLIDLPGANKGSFGPMFGISFIGVEFKLKPGFYLVVDPTYLFIDAPHLTGVPLLYYQYRFQVGIEFGG